MKPLRFGVVGCGTISTLAQLPALKRCKQVDLVALADLDVEWARDVAKRFAVPEVFEDYHRLIGRVEAVLVATPNATHADIACALLDAGVHVLCEKPMATSRAAAERMFAAAARTGARLMAGHCLRFSPNLAMLKHIVSARWLGTVADISGGVSGSYDDTHYRTDFRRQRNLSGGGVLIDLGIHLIDLAIWLADEAPCEVAYDGSSARGGEVEHDGDVVLQFPRALRAELSSSFMHALSNALVVRGSCGWASAPLYAPTELSVFSDKARVCQQAGLQELALPDVSMYDRQIAHFCEGVRSGEQFVVRPAEVLAGMGVIDQCYGAP